ncbi:TetR family transcriptional regulator [Streptomyces sp. NPDC048603]|uniref:TetR family transcriptional regulator n=1 Tax=Streptomyces sp. NPDC048603 TaxID=3365577 RepID=UPI00371D1A00
MKQDRARRTRQRILDVAAEEFSTHGYALTTMHDIARRIGMTKGALYGQFASKDALAQALLDHGLSRITGLRTLVVRDGDPFADLGRFTSGLARCLHTDVRLRAALRLLTDGTGAVLPVDPLAEAAAHIGTLIRRAQSRGQIDPEEDPADLAQLLLCIACAVWTTPRLAPARPPDAWAEWAWGRVAASLRRP